MNNYFEDAAIFLREASKVISDPMEKSQVIQATMNCAFGIERILKGILSDVNPTYILVDPSFNNSVKILYREKLIDQKDGHFELSKHPNADVITFKTSLLRAQSISPTAFNNKNLLFALSSARDIIAHNELTHLSIPTLTLLLQRDFYVLITSFCTELSISKNKYFGGLQIKLSELASERFEDIGKKLELLFEAHRERWLGLKNREGYVEGNERITGQILKKDNAFPTLCPACKNIGVILAGLVWESVKDEDPYVSGIEVEEFQCRYCKLRLTDYHSLDYMKFDDIVRLAILNSDM